MKLLNFIHTLQEKLRMFLWKHPFLVNKRHHLFGFGLAFWPLIVFFSAASYFNFHDFRYGFIYLIFTPLGVPIAFIMQIFIEIFSALSSEPIALLLSFFINPLIHYIVGMWIGYFLRKTSRRLQDGILKFLFITPLIVLFLFWRYG